MPSTSSRKRVRDHRARPRAQGLRPVQIWAPDVRAPGLAEEAHHQSRAVAASVAAADDQELIHSVTICPFTTDPTDAPLFRLNIEATPLNGLQESCRLMVDKLTTVSRSKLGVQVGALEDTDLVRLNGAIVVFLGIASTSR